MLERGGLNDMRDRAPGRGEWTQGVINNTKDFLESSYEKLPLQKCPKL